MQSGSISPVRFADLQWAKNHFNRRTASTSDSTIGQQWGVKYRIASWFNTSRALVACFSLLYFSDVWLRAQQKPFWSDEMLTVYFSRIPKPKLLWAALQHGLEFIPPGFYLLTRAIHQLLARAKSPPGYLRSAVFGRCAYACSGSRIAPPGPELVRFTAAQAREKLRLRSFRVAQEITLPNPIQAQINHIPILNELATSMSGVRHITHVLRIDYREKG